MKNTIISTVLLFTSILINAQGFNLDWAFTTGANVQDFGKSIASDSDGNSYITGDFRNTVDFDPSSSILNLTALGSDDIFVMKLNSEGELVWVKSLGGTESESSTSITLDSQGNIYIAGNFWGPTDFDPSDSELVLNSNGSDDIFVVKLNNNGDLIWAKSFGSEDRDNGVTILVDQNDNPILTGYFYETADFDPGSGTHFLTAKSSFWEDTFVLKLSKEGEFSWALSFGGDEIDVPRDMDIDSNGNIYITGLFQSVTDLDPGVGQSIHTANNNSSDYFVLKLDDTGNFKWAKSFGGISGESANSIAVDKLGSVYVSGEFRKSIDYSEIDNSIESNGETDVFINKIDQEGNLVWARSIGSGKFDSGRSINIDPEGNLWVTGYFEDALPLWNSSQLVSNGGSDIFLINIDPDGEVITSFSFGGTSFEYGGNTFIDNNQSIYVTGWFYDNFNIDVEGNDFSSVSNGERDIFSIKLNSKSTVLGLDGSQAHLVYPNPLASSFSIKSNELVEKVSLIDMRGEVLHTWSIGKNTILYIPENINSGVYFIQIKTELTTEFKKVLIKK